MISHRALIMNVLAVCGEWTIAVCPAIGPRCRCLAAAHIARSVQKRCAQRCSLRGVALCVLFQMLTFCSAHETAAITVLMLSFASVSWVNPPFQPHPDQAQGWEPWIPPCCAALHCDLVD